MCIALPCYANKQLVINKFLNHSINNEFQVVLEGFQGPRGFKFPTASKRMWLNVYLHVVLIAAYSEEDDIFI